MLLLIDNYDSCTYNLVQLVGTVARELESTLGGPLEVRVVRNDQIDADAAQKLRPSHVIVSPGPCTPKEAGVSGEIIRSLAPEGVPTLGVCLGHQCIADGSGFVVERATKLMHGKTDLVRHDGRTIFRDVPSPFTAARYHSLIVRRETIDQQVFDISAETAAGEVMGLRHKTWPLEGVQFHPESFLTEHGAVMIRNFLRKVDR